MKPEHYERSAAAYDFFNQSKLKSPRIRTFVEHVARLLPPGAEVCDAGGGTGIHAGYLLDLRPDVIITLVEPAGNMLAIARQRLGGRVRFVPDTIQDALPRIREQDAIIFIRSLYALADTPGDYEHLFRRISAGLKDNGLLCIYDIHPPVDVDAARAWYAAACAELGLREEFDRHWAAFAEYLREFNRLLQANRVGILDHRQRDTLLLELDFRKIYLDPAVSLHRKTASRKAVSMRDDIRDFTCIQDGDDHYLLNIDLSAVFKINAALRDVLEHWRDNPGEAVSDPGLIGVLNQLELVRDKNPPRAAQTPGSGVGHLMLNVCQDCNLACVYCYGGEGEYGHRSRMTRDTARAAVDWLIRNSQKIETVRITFFGGEPLLDFDLVKFVVEYAGPEAERHGKKAAFSLTTNATLLTDEMVHYLRTAHVHLQISYDGELQDAQRPYKDGTGTSAAVLEAIKRVTRVYDGDIGIISTIAAPDIDIAGLREKLREFRCERMHIRRASPLFAGCGGGCGIDPGGMKEAVLPDGLDRMFIADLELQFQENLELIRQRRDVIGNDLRKILSILLFRGKLTHFCGAGRGLVACAANGDLYPCHRFNGLEEYRMGNLSNFDPCARDWYDETTVEGIPACRECWARYLCGGGCLYDDLNNPRGELRPPEASCELFKHTVKIAVRLFARLSVDDKEFLKQKLGPPQAAEPAWW